MFPIRSNGAIALVFTAAVAVSCAGEDPTEVPPPPQTSDAVAAVSGNGQSASTGQPLADPLVVSVTNDGAPVGGATVTWAVASGGGSVNPASSSTDAAGQASTAWTLGANAGTQTVTAAVASATGSPVMFSATGNAPPPTTAAISVQDNSFAPNSQSLAAGGTVTWTWSGNNQHNVTFTSGTNSQTQNAGTFDRTFPTAGQFAYLCTIHGSVMSGTIVVQ